MSAFFDYILQVFLFLIILLFNIALNPSLLLRAANNYMS